MHFHALFLDGVYRTGLYEEPVFEELETPAPEELANLTRRLHRRIFAALRKKGFLPEEDEDDSGPDDPSAHDACIAGAVQGRRALGPEAGHPLPRLRGPEPEPQVDSRKLACRYGGFSLHAGRRVACDSRHSLEQLCRYAARPAFVHERLHRTNDGKLLYALKRPWSDGSSHVVFDAQTLLERLAALVPRPKFPLVTYHGVLAPASSLRHRIVPEPPPPPSCAHESEKEPAPERPSKGRRRRYYRWAELLQRVFLRFTDCT